MKSCLLSTGCRATIAPQGNVKELLIIPWLSDNSIKQITNVAHAPGVWGLTHLGLTDLIQSVHETVSHIFWNYKQDSL